MPLLEWKPFIESSLADIFSILTANEYWQPLTALIEVLYCATFRVRITRVDMISLKECRKALDVEKGLSVAWFLSRDPEEESTLKKKEDQLIIWKTITLFVDNALYFVKKRVFFYVDRKKICLKIFLSREKASFVPNYIKHMQRTWFYQLKNLPLPVRSWRYRKAFYDAYRDIYSLLAKALKEMVSEVFFHGDLRRSQCKSGKCSWDRQTWLSNFCNYLLLRTSWK